MSNVIRLTSKLVYLIIEAGSKLAWLKKLNQLKRFNHIKIIQIYIQFEVVNLNVIKRLVDKVYVVDDYVNLT